MEERLPAEMRRNHWGTMERWLVFGLASSSIGCLMADFYGVCRMRTFALFVFLPAMAALAGLGILDRARGDGRLWRAVLIGLAGGLGAAVAYDVFRLPFVFAKEWGIEAVVPAMPLFKVFAGFGAMALGEPLEQAHYSLTTQLVGWLYHFSNGATFGVMYVAMIGEGRRRHWAWAVVFAVALELGMLFTPYPAVFHIALTARFVVVTMAAHGIFGVCMGLAVRALATRT